MSLIPAHLECNECGGYMVNRPGLSSRCKCNDAKPALKPLNIDEKLERLHK